MSPLKSKIATAAISAALAFSTAIASSAAFAEPVLEPTTRNFINALEASGGPAIYTLTPTEARNVLSGAQSGKIAKPVASILPIPSLASVRPARQKSASSVLLEIRIACLRLSISTALAG